jgi:hypothetical protein
MFSLRRSLGNTQLSLGIRAIVGGERSVVLLEGTLGWIELGVFQGDAERQTEQ